MKHTAIPAPRVRAIDADHWRAAFRRMMADRRTQRRGSLEHEWRTNACRKYVRLMLGVPVNEWSN